MNRQAQLLTVGLVVAVLAVVAALMVTGGSLRNAAEQTEPSGDASLESPEESPEEPPEPDEATSPTVPAQPEVRLPEPTPGGEGPGRSAKQRRKADARARRALVPEAPELASGSLACIEAIAQRRTLTAVTFNIHGGFRGRRLNLEGIGREIARLDADLVLLQEVDRGRKRSRGQNQAQILADRLDMNVAYDPNSRGRGGGSTGNAVLSHLPITSVRRAPLPPGGAQPRGVMRVVVDIENVEVAVYVTHLEHTSGAVRLRQIRYVTRAVGQEGLPHLVGGDLNASPDTPVLGIARRTLADLWPAAGRGLGRTVPRARIDYLLHGQSLRPLGARVVPSRISDHDALLGAFEVGPPDACQQQ